MITAKARAVDGPDKSFRAAEIKRRDLDLNLRETSWFF